MLTRHSGGRFPSSERERRGDGRPLRQRISASDQKRRHGQAPSFDHSTFNCRNTPPEARRRIAAAARESTNELDLGGLGLVEIPEELYALTQLNVPWDSQTPSEDILLEAYRQRKREPPCAECASVAAGPPPTRPRGMRLSAQSTSRA
jgi:hypothetical protein